MNDAVGLKMFILNIHFHERAAYLQGIDFHGEKIEIGTVVRLRFNGCHVVRIQLFHSYRLQIGDKKMSIKLDIYNQPEIQKGCFDLKTAMLYTAFPVISSCKVRLEILSSDYGQCGNDPKKWRLI
jgi:hypothetical protein